MRVAVTQCFHEANAFAPLPITIDDFKRRHYLSGDAVRTRFSTDRDWLTGILDGLDAAGAETAIGLCAGCLPGGVVERASFDAILAHMCAEMRAIVAAGAPDLLMLALHGALVVEGVDEPESDIAAAMRAIVGPDVVIAITLDFHANVNPRLPDYAQIIVVGQDYPHVDTYARGRKAVELALRAQDASLQTFVFPLPLVVPLPSQSTVADEPGAHLLRAVSEIERTHGVPDIAVAGGFAYGNADYMGMSVLIVSASHSAAAAAFRDVATIVSTLRASFLKPIRPLETGWADVLDAAARGRVVIADVADGPGAGGTGDEVALLRQLIDHPVPDVRFVSGFHVDPTVALAAAEVGVGNTARFTFGTTRQYARNPVLSVEARVLKSGDISYCNTGPMMQGARLDGGLGAVLAVPNGIVVVTTERIQAYDVNAFISQGIDLTEMGVIALKTSAHFRASYTPLATGGIVLLDGGGWSSPDLSVYAFDRAIAPRLPFVPMDERAWQTAIDVAATRLPAARLYDGAAPR
ncbi:M81 family metallopeptidase [Robbsia sp. KACC 23696]|uniref:M81 family metallopeptidase n=1 Tax=Robbsia sp. KACC 23696 TaxID=3149231 RepID=UPI00325B0E25